MALRVGECFMLGFRGLEPPAWLLDFERRFGLGGVLLFDRDLEHPGEPRNVESPAQLATLCASLHDLPSRPLVFVDQEGGRVRRLKPERGFRELPAAAELAALPAAQAARLVDASLREMKALGIDFDLAPVVDLDLNPENPNIGALGRAFSADPAEVRRCARLFDAAARGCGLGLCLKHYPGLGGATVDTHEARADLSATLSPAQLALFAELAVGIAGEAVLLSHGLVRAWDPHAPVSLSPAAVRRLRRDAPDALVVSDDLQMAGLRAWCGTREAALRALGAGVDLLCIGNNLLAEQAECAEAASAVESAAERDEALRARLAQATARIRDRKRRAAGPARRRPAG